MRKLTYDPTTWADFEKSEIILCPDREAHVKLSQPGAVYVQVGKRWQLVQHGTEMRITFPDHGYKIKSDTSGVFFVDSQQPIEDHNEVLTNMDKRPGKNGAEEAIARMLRLQKIKEQSEAIEREQANLDEATRRRERGLTDTMPEGVVEPVVQPPAEPEAEGEPETA